MTERTNDLQSKARPLGRGLVLAIILIVVSIGVAMVLKEGSTTRASEQVSDTPVLPPPLPVNTQQVFYESAVSQTRSYTGTIRARQSSDLAFELPGTITHVLVSEGDAVQANQVLARLDTRILVAKRSAIEAQLSQAQAIQDELTAGPRDERIRSAAAQLAARESDFRLAKLNHNRRQNLHAAGAISDEEFDQAKFGLQSAEANLRDAKEQLSELETGTRKEQLAAQDSAVRQLESSLDEINVSIEKSNLIAPFAGTVSRRYADDGSIAAASAPVVRLIESGTLEAIVGLPSNLAGHHATSNQSLVMLRVGNREVEATVRSRVREIDPVTRTQNVLLDISPADVARVVPGELCQWQIEQTVDRSGFWLPTSALTRGIRGLWSVMVVVEENGQSLAEKRDIEIILTESERVLARGTLADGDRVVVDGLHRIADGQRIMTASFSKAIQ